MKLLFIPLLLLAGCGLCPQKEGPVSFERIVVKVPEEHLIIPDYLNSINYETATYKDVATWIINSEDRMKQLETKLKKISEYNDSIK